MPHPKQKTKVQNVTVKLDFDYIREKLLQYAELPIDSRPPRKSSRKTKPKPKLSQYQYQELKTTKNVRRPLRPIQRFTCKTPSTEEEPVDDCYDKIHFPKVIPSVLGRIIEKNYDDYDSFDEKPMPAQGFPVVSKRSVIEKGDNKEQLVNTESFDQFDSIPFSELSEEQILKEQQKLITKPEEQEFAMADPKAATDEAAPTTADTTKSNEKNSDTTPKIDSDESFWDNDIFTNIDINNWMHLDTLEKDKLEWMKNIEEHKTVNPDEPYEARFDFKGYLLPYKIDYTEETRTLYHHGEESHRPGYSLSELFVLTQSVIPQQKAMALNTIAGILEYYSVGTYKNILELPLSQIFFHLRFAIDDNKPMVLEPGLRALRNLLCNKVDEASLDVLLGTIDGVVQPYLGFKRPPGITEIELRDSEKKEFYIAEIDIYTALMKSDILERFYYILETVRPSSNCVQYCLQILTRLVRENLNVIDKITESEDLMHTIVKNFMPASSIKSTFKPQNIYGKPFLPALKFIRVLAIQSKEINELLVDKYEITKPLAEYISSNVSDNYGMRLQIESYSIYTNLIHLNVGIESLTALAPVLIGSFHKHVKRTNVLVNSSVLLATHAGCVIQVVNKLVNCNTTNFNKFKHQVVPMVKEGIKKWIAQLLHSNTYTAGMLRPICSALYLCKSIMLSMKAPVKFLSVPLKELSSSKIYKEIASKLVPCSNLLSGIESQSFHRAKNLKTLSTTVIDSPDKVLPVLRKDSPYTLFAAIFNVLCLLEDTDLVSEIVDKMVPYFRLLYTTKEPSLCDNWMTRLEVGFLFNYVITAFFKETKINPDWTFTISHKLGHILGKDQWIKLDFLLNSVIFSKKFLSPENVFNFMSLTGVGNPSKITTYIADTKSRYKDSYNLNIKFPKAKCLLWEQSILPKDWLYLPLSVLYEMKHNVNWRVDKGDTIEDAKIPSIVECSLRWILFIEKCYPELVHDTDVTDRFLRVMSIYLLGKPIFSNTVIKDLLKKYITAMFKKTNDFNFDKKFMGAYNFEDYYREVLKQFQSVGTEDSTFIACVIVPIAQKHNVKWRQMLWSEFSSCLNAIKCPSELLHYDDDDYMFPLETDETLLKLYTQAITSFSLKSTTLTYTIAHHHIKSSLKNITGTASTSTESENVKTETESTDASEK
ncbi:uncharacterized protein LOC131848865 [Achroia grisella]|uniref:uncharacterized protein LOC131848865 n=1 Tax=Achroia grisella TaxID=688607 RepID=UPI0027D1F12A|nr:uncharacterized protein LOC131848865 [Achroia grisella]